MNTKNYYPIKKLTVIHSVKTTNEKNDRYANENLSRDRCHVFAYPRGLRCDP